MTKDELLHEMKTLAALINNEKKRALYEKRQIAKLTLGLKKLKAKYELDVLNELDSAGKAKFSNSEKRTAEVNRLLDLNADYREQEDLVESKQMIVEDSELDASYNSYLFRAYEVYGKNNE